MEKRAVGLLFAAVILGSIVLFGIAAAVGSASVQLSTTANILPASNGKEVRGQAETAAAPVIIVKPVSDNAQNQQPSTKTYDVSLHRQIETIQSDKEHSLATEVKKVDRETGGIDTLTVEEMIAYLLTTAIQFDVTASDGKILHAKLWCTSGTKRPLVVLVHGIGGDQWATTFPELTYALVSAGYAVLSYEYPWEIVSDFSMLIRYIGDVIRYVVSNYYILVDENRCGIHRYSSLPLASMVMWLIEGLFAANG